MGILVADIREKVANILPLSMILAAHFSEIPFARLWKSS